MTVPELRDGEVKASAIGPRSPALAKAVAEAVDLAGGDDAAYAAATGDSPWEDQMIPTVAAPAAITSAITHQRRVGRFLPWRPSGGVTRAPQSLYVVAQPYPDP